MPVASVEVERSFSLYKHILNKRCESLTEENTKRLVLLYYNGDIEGHFLDKLTIISICSVSFLCKHFLKRKNYSEAELVNICNGKLFFLKRKLIGYKFMVICFGDCDNDKTNFVS